MSFKIHKQHWFILSIILFVLSAGITFAASDGIISIKTGEVIPTDKFIGAQSLTNDGTIQGDLFCFSQLAVSRGAIEGDFIAMASDINLSGTVSGDARIGGSTITIAGDIGRNVNAFGGTITLTDKAIVGRNLLVAGGNIAVNGQVKGSSHIYGGNITLNGEFFGDVTVDTGSGDPRDQVVRLTVLPGTIIHGRLTYRGAAAAIQNGSKINDYQWVKPKINYEKQRAQNTTDLLWKLIKLLFTTGIYFLIGLLLYRLFPKIFEKQGAIIREKPLGVIGVGLATLFSTIVSLILVIILLLLAIFLISPSVGLIFASVALLAYILLFYLSTIPVSLWLGNAVFGEKLSLPYRLGIGLAVITIGLFIFDVISQFFILGSLFSVLSFIIKFSVLVIGLGALLYGIRDLHRAAQKGESAPLSENSGG